MTRLARLLLALAVIGVVGSLAWVGGGTAWHLMGHDGTMPAAVPLPPEAAPDAAAPDLGAIAALNPFGAVPEPEPEAPVAETALDLVLRGVLLNPDPARSLALISADGAPVRSFRPGSEITERAVLDSIAADRVVLRVDGRRETLSFPDAARTGGGLGGGGDADGGAIPEEGVDRLRALIDAANRPETADDVEGWIDIWRGRITRNPNEVLRELGLAQVEGGYRVEDSSGSALRGAGLRPGDLVARVNGRALGDGAVDAATFDEVVASGLARVEIMREGRAITLSFPIR
ncbi:type II secretion system protein N [Jannaschia sp. W003]|uniref:type II secretion system protein N n=1 Tax=Jannaschia sp. W003 TaxID=2867012 RepID=UPI0021A64778|nr:type II secretion system protein N [Jannaschia sp. W003]UWQ23170.1 hypothetical protein K3554_16455 [Jannaschia sp. W003]